MKRSTVTLSDFLVLNQVTHHWVWTSNARWRKLILIQNTCKVSLLFVMHVHQCVVTCYCPSWETRAAWGHWRPWETSSEWGSLKGPELWGRWEAWRHLTGERWAHWEEDQDLTGSLNQQTSQLWGRLSGSVPTWGSGGSGGPTDMEKEYFLLSDDCTCIWNPSPSASFTWNPLGGRLLMWLL